MSNAPLFQNADEQEAVYAPQQVPGAAGRAQLEGDANTGDLSAANEPPAAAPVANVGSSASGVAAPPNITNDDQGGAAGNPGTQARYPLDDNDRT
jgi:hypothetical protein